MKLRTDLSAKVTHEVVELPEVEEEMDPAEGREEVEVVVSPSEKHSII